MVFIIILLGMLLFAGLHTLSASQTFKQKVRERVGDRAYHGFYRISYNIFALVSLAPVTMTIGFSDTIIWEIAETQQTLISVILVIQMIGTVGMIISLFQIDILRFAGVKQVWAYFTGGELPLKDEPLQHKGLYQYVRHPLYFFALLSMWFVPIMIDSQLLFTIAATAYFLIGSRWEEQRMVKAFGEDYIDYQQSVSWLIPFVKFR
jgi:methanethiol S-methyltransferase